jgi:hypothetical protein
MLKNDSPSSSLAERETEHLLLCFCTYCGLLKGKKLSLQNVFVLVLRERRIRNLLKDLLSVDSNFELVKMFLDFDPTIAESKYITKYLNSHKDVFL